VDAISSQCREGVGLGAWPLRGGSGGGVREELEDRIESSAKRSLGAIKGRKGRRFLKLKKQAELFVGSVQLLSLGCFGPTRKHCKKRKRSCKESAKGGRVPARDKRAKRERKCQDKGKGNQHDREQRTL